MAFRVYDSLRSWRLEVVGERENGRARRRHEGEGATSPLACLPLERPFFLVPTIPSACNAGCYVVGFAATRTTS